MTSGRGDGLDINNKSRPTVVAGEAGRFRFVEWEGRTMANAERLQRVLTYIEEHPDQWNQAHWHCGSSHCFCGTAQILAGHAPGSGRIFDQVCKWLGLSDSEFDVLAATGNTLEDLRRHVGDLIAGRPATVTVAMGSARATSRAHPRASAVSANGEKSAL